jgi:hypothetical protein
MLLNAFGELRDRTAGISGVFFELMLIALTCGNCCNAGHDHRHENNQLLTPSHELGCVSTTIKAANYSGIR